MLVGVLGVLLAFVVAHRLEWPEGVASEVRLAELAVDFELVRTSSVPATEAARYGDDPLMRIPTLDPAVEAAEEFLQRRDD